jgi:DNA polymerase III epsilon subunit-like protein
MTHLDQFLSSITVLDTETTNMDPTICEIVEVAGARWSKGSWHATNLLLGAYNGIPPEASAKNNISNKMIAGLYTFSQSVDKVKKLLFWDKSNFQNTSDFFVAHNADYDRKALRTAFMRINSISDIEQCDDKSRWICTYRLSKHILAHNFGDIQYSQNYLRYKLDLNVDDSLGAHRADIDALVCAALLEKLIEIGIIHHQINPNDPIGPQLNELCWSYIPITTWPVGKYKGKLLTELENDYYAWALNNLPRLDESSLEYDEDLAESVRVTLSDRLTDLEGIL